MADALCGPSNPLQTFQKHTSADRTLQQERLTARQSPAETFRSSPSPNAGILDAEFYEFQRSQGGLALDNSRLEHQSQFPRTGSSIGSPFQEPGIALPPNWASDFQNLHVNEGPFPIPQAQFHQRASLQRSTPSGWHQEFLRQQNQSPSTPQQGYHQSYRPSVQSPSYYQPSLVQQNNQPATESALGTSAEAELDDDAFEKAFEQAKMDILQAETQNKTIDQTSQGPKTPNYDYNAFVMYEPPPNQPPIGSDRILAKSEELGKGKEKEDNGANDVDELARTAGTLLENVKGDQSWKFQESSFLSLMRQLRDREVRVEGDKIVDVTQPLHPGGEFYPHSFDAQQ